MLHFSWTKNTTLLHEERLLSQVGKQMCTPLLGTANHWFTADFCGNLAPNLVIEICRWWYQNSTVDLSCLVLLSQLEYNNATHLGAARRDSLLVQLFDVVRLIFIKLVHFSSNFGSNKRKLLSFLSPSINLFKSFWSSDSKYPEKNKVTIYLRLSIISDSSFFSKPRLNQRFLLKLSQKVNNNSKKKWKKWTKFWG